jgi:hypothetical protein
MQNKRSNSGNRTFFGSRLYATHSSSQGLLCKIGPDYYLIASGKCHPGKDMSDRTWSYHIVNAPTNVTTYDGAHEDMAVSQVAQAVASS